MDDFSDTDTRYTIVKKRLAPKYPPGGVMKRQPPWGPGRRPRYRRSKTWRYVGEAGCGRTCSYDWLSLMASPNTALMDPTALRNLGKSDLCGRAGRTCWRFATCRGGAGNRCRVGRLRESTDLLISRAARPMLCVFFPTRFDPLLEIASRLSSGQTQSC